MKKGKIIIISGPSGSGKTTLYKKLLKDPKLKTKLFKSISVTTRPKRKGEKHGRDYIFVSRKMFLFKKKAGHFLESEKVFDNHYGTPDKNARRLLNGGKNVLLCIDVKGAKTVRRKYPNAVTVFIKVPGMSVLKRRLKLRGSEMDRVLELRLKTAIKELKEAKNYLYTIVNDDLRSAYMRLRRIIVSEIGSK